MKGRAKEKNKIEDFMQLPYSILLHEVEDDGGQKYWMAEIPELPGCKSHGSTVEEAVKSVDEAKRDWISDSLEKGEEVPIPIDRDRYSGKMLVRMSRSLHRSLSLMAEAEKLSLNQLIVTILAKEVGRLDVLRQMEGKVNKLLDKVDDVLEKGVGQYQSLPYRINSFYKENPFNIWNLSKAIGEVNVAACIGMKAQAVGTTDSPNEITICSDYLEYPKWKNLYSSADSAAVEEEERVELK